MKKSEFKKLLGTMSKERIQSELNEYEHRKQNHFPNRWLYFGLVFRSRQEIKTAEKYLKGENGLK